MTTLKTHENPQYCRYSLVSCEGRNQPFPVLGASLEKDTKVTETVVIGSSIVSPQDLWPKRESVKKICGVIHFFGFVQCVCILGTLWLVHQTVGTFGQMISTTVPDSCDPTYTLLGILVHHPMQHW